MNAQISELELIWNVAPPSRDTTSFDINKFEQIQKEWNEMIAFLQDPQSDIEVPEKITAESDEPVDYDFDLRKLLDS